MSYTFDWLSKDVVKKLQGRDSRPVKCSSDATKFCSFNILQETSSRLALKTEYIPVGFTLSHLLEPNIPVPEPEVSAPIPLKHTISQKSKADSDVETIAGGEAGFVKSCGYDIEVQSKSIPNPKSESLQNRKSLDQLPTFMKTCWKDGKNSYVVTEAYEVTKDTVSEGTSNSKFAIKGIINQLVKVGGSGQWQTEKTDSIPIQKGSVLAYKKQQLVIEDNTCVILTSANTKKKMTFPMRFVGMSGHLRYQDLVIETGSWINDIDPIGTIKEPTHLDFMCLQNEVSEQTRLSAELSKDVQEVVFSSFSHMLCDRDVSYDSMKMSELNQLGHMDGPGGKISDELRKDSSLSWINLKDLILYLLQASMVSSDTQLCSSASSVEMRLLPHQVESVKSILQPNFKYPWNIPFTLQPQLLAPLQGEGLAITYELSEECGSKMESNNPRSTWDLEAKMPSSALYGSSSFLQQLSEA